MVLLTQIVCVLVLLAITVQDIREKKVYLGLLLCSGFFMSYLYLVNTQLLTYFTNLSINLLVLLLIFGVLFFYVKLKLKRPLLSVLGSGDLFFFLIIAISFPVTTFVILFSFSLFFASVIFRVLPQKTNNNYVPLAGLQALFLALVLSSNWLFQFVNLYAL